MRERDAPAYAAMRRDGEQTETEQSQQRAMSRSESDLERLRAEDRRRAEEQRDEKLQLCASEQNSRAEEIARLRDALEKMKKYCHSQSSTWNGEEQELAVGPDNRLQFAAPTSTVAMPVCERGTPKDVFMYAFDRAAADASKLRQLLMQDRVCSDLLKGDGH